MGHSATSTQDLNRVGRVLFGGDFCGTYPYAKNPRLNSEGKCCIVNTMKNGPGEHWFALIRGKSETLAYDSFGRTLSNHQYSDPDVEQGVFEENCGQRCLAWLCVAKNHGVEAALLI